MYHGDTLTEPTEPTEPDKKPSDITRLLFKAVKELPEDEQRAVFAYFFERGIGLPQPPFFPQPPFSGQLSHVQSGSARRVVGSGQTTIPVRLSEAQHRRLKAWCAEHNFPMSVVVRGLIDRFLDSWDKRST